MLDKAELLNNVTKARSKAQVVAEKLRQAREAYDGQAETGIEMEALDLHYKLAIEELEEAINAAGVTEYE